MKLEYSLEFDPDADIESLFAPIEHRPAVFVLFPDRRAPGSSPPYIGRTGDLHRRLARVLRKQQGNSKLLSLREVAGRIEYQYSGSGFELQWLVYLLNRHYYPRQYRSRMRLKPPTLLKLNLRNRFPRLYPTGRILNDGSLYYGPFPSRAAAERFAGEFLDLFKIRRCIEDLNPTPSHPGCIYSQMRMCLAPCFEGCTDIEYQNEVERVEEFLGSEGQSMARDLETERNQASDELDFERASQIHRKIEKVRAALDLKPEPVRNIRDLHAIIVLPGARPKAVSFFLMCSGSLSGPLSLDLGENVSSPLSLDERFRQLFEPFATKLPERAGTSQWEHLALFAKWYYSSFRRGEIVMLPSPKQIPHARLIRICRKILMDCP